MSSGTTRSSGGVSFLVFLAFIGILLVLAGVGALLVWLLPHLSPEVAAAGITVFGIWTVTLLQKEWERRRQIEQELRQQKSRVYCSFVEFWYEYINREKTGREKMTQADLIAFFSQFSAQLTIWGSNEVIRRVAEWRYLALNRQGEKPEAEMLEKFEAVWFAMRVDLGHKDKDLKRGNLLCLFVNDIPDYFPSSTIVINEDDRDKQQAA